ncbi:hypothetical protein COOONC_24479 [Cooperia oncophora]
MMLENHSELHKVISNVVKIVLILRSVDRSYIMPRKMTNYIFSKFDKLHRFHSSDRKDILKVLNGITYLGNYEDPEDFSTVIKLFDFLKNMLPDPSTFDADLESGYLERNEPDWSTKLSEIELVSLAVYNILRRSRSTAEDILSASDIWKPRFQYFVNVIRVYTQRLKRKLDEEIKEEHNADNSKLLKIANNVGYVV